MKDFPHHMHGKDWDNLHHKFEDNSFRVSPFCKTISHIYSSSIQIYHHDKTNKCMKNTSNHRIKEITIWINQWGIFNGIFLLVNIGIQNLFSHIPPRNVCFLSCTVQIRIKDSSYTTRTFTRETNKEKQYYGDEQVKIMNLNTFILQICAAAYNFTWSKLV